MPGPCCHLATRVVLMLTNGIVGILLVLSLLMTFYSTDISAHLKSQDSNPDKKVVKGVMLYTIFTRITHWDGEDPIQVKAADTLQKACGAFVIIGIISSLLNFIFYAVLVGVQSSWNKGGSCCIARERGIAIMALVLSFVLFFCGLIAMALIIDRSNAYQAMYDDVEGVSQSSGDMIVIFGSHRRLGGVWLLIVIFVLTLLNLGVACIPCFLGVRYCCGCGACCEDDGDDGDFSRGDGISRDDGSMYSRASSAKGSRASRSASGRGGTSAISSRQGSSYDGSSQDTLTNDSSR